MRYRDERADCPRCKKSVEVDRAHPIWKRLKTGWWIGTGTIAVLAPVIAADVFILSPLAIAFLLGGSTITRQAKQAPSCRRCQLALEIETEPTGPIVRPRAKSPPTSF
jgi:hypothetical protein